MGRTWPVGAEGHRRRAAVLERTVHELGAETDMAALDPDQVAVWFSTAWGRCSTKTFNARLSALGSACL